MSNNEKKNEELPIVPAARIYHATADNTGAALSVRVFPATIQRNGFTQLEFAGQSETAEDGITARFDWKHRAVIRLNFAETAELALTLSSGYSSPHFVVLERDSSPKWQASFNCSPFGGGDSRVSLSLKYKAGENPYKTISLALSREEAFGLGIALKSVMGRLCFG